MATFSLLYTGRVTVLFLCQVVNSSSNVAEKVDECPLNQDRYVLFVYNWEREKCPLYGAAGCLLFRGF